MRNYLVLTKPGCPWCDAAKSLLVEKGYSSAIFETCSDIHDARVRVARVVGERNARSGVSSFPVVVNTDRGILVGGYEKLRDEIDEPLLSESDTRFSAFPIRYMDLWSMYKKAVAGFWTSEEVSLKDDVVQWTSSLNDDERHFISHVLAFFASADGIVNENLAANFSVEIQIPEARAFYAYQMYSESIHNEMYGLLIDAVIRNASDRDRLFGAIRSIPCVRAKASWALKWLDRSRPFAERLIAFACVEGILFSGSFCSIYWLKKRGLMPGLSMSNEFISRDEGQHQAFACVLYRHVKHPVSANRALDIVREAVHNEKDFICEAIPCNLVGMNSSLMSEYIEFVADRLLLELGYDRAFGTANPFPWMEMISLSGKTNFFEGRVSEYARAGMLVEGDDASVFGIDENF
jgi:ribonucleotide reductase beta subunit family protein with ferritin-like domain